MVEEVDLSKLEAELESDDSTDTSVPPDRMAAIKLHLRTQLLDQFHTFRLAARLSRKVGDNQQAEAQFNEAKTLLKKIAALDSDE